MKRTLALASALLCGCSTTNLTINNPDTINPAFCHGLHCSGLVKQDNTVSVYLLDQHNEINAVSRVIDGRSLPLNSTEARTRYGVSTDSTRLSERIYWLNIDQTEQIRQAVRAQLRIRLNSYSIENTLKDGDRVSPAYNRIADQ